jgi:hypothetical protein
MQISKIVSAALFGLVFSLPTFAQSEEEPKESPKNNIVKINLSALVLKNISVQYERKVGKRVSIAANVHYRPFGQLPFLSSIEKAIDDPSVPVDKLKWGGLGVTPEVRFYVGKNGALRGFYFAPFVNISNYKADLPIDYSDGTTDRTGIFNGNISTVTGGLLLGAQWKLGKSVYLDWWIIGPNYGSAKGDLNLATALSATEQTDLRNQIEDLIADAPFDQLVESYSVNGGGATIRAKGPWAGLRGLGFNLGFRF